MMTIDFEYHRPDTLEQAVQIFVDLDRQGKNPVYYGGGTEIISMGRMDNIQAGAVIDIKGIPQCRVQEIKKDYLIIGAGVTLTEIHEANLFPLLAQAGARVADHTIQNKVTLGGNLCGTIIYREAVLPLLLAESQVLITGPGGSRTLPIDQIFDQRIRLEHGEFIVQVFIHTSYLSRPYIHVKRTKQDKINYPLVTICAMRVDQAVRTAFSGLCDFPFRSPELERHLNDRKLPLTLRVEQAIAALPAEIPDNIEGSAGYRRFILKQLMTSILTELEGPE
ncbi:MAG: FAD binding domain-containing protein [Deltaproteobacteria bacterium]